MPGKDHAKNEGHASQEQASQPPATTGQASDMRKLLVTLDEVFSTFGNQLKDETPPPFDGNAKVAVDVFNDIVAGLRLKFLPQALKIGGRAVSLTEIELTWTDDTNNADGYKVKRCQGQNCSDLVEVRQLSPAVRSFLDVNLAPYTTYRYQVVAFNFRGETSSNIVDVTTATTKPA
jgi:hypothetical protein